MGRNAGSTAEEVIAAGKGILAVGGKVTGWELKKALGGIGRPDRFESIWQAHLQENAPPPEPEPELDWPLEIADLEAETQQAVTEMLHGIVIRSWRTALALTNDRVRKERDALTAERAEHQEYRQAAQEASDMADEARSQLEIQVETLTLQLDAARREAAALSERATAGEARCETLQHGLAVAEDDIVSARQAAAVANATAMAAEAAKAAAIVAAEAARQQAGEAIAGGVRDHERAEAAEAVSAGLMHEHELSKREMAAERRAAASAMAEAVAALATQQERTNTAEAALATIKASLEQISLELAAARETAIAAEADAAAVRAEIERSRADRKDAEAARRQAEVALAVARAGQGSG